MGDRSSCPAEWLPWGVRFDRPSLPYTTCGIRIGQLLAYAGELVCVGERDPSAVVCVGSDDRVDVAAALLAALAGGPRLLLPHSLAEGDLLELAKIHPFSHLIRRPEATETAPALRLQPETVPWIRVDPEACLKSERGALTWSMGGGGSMGGGSSMGGGNSPIGWLFTGGSTGRRKSWSKGARELLSEAAGIVRKYGIGPEHRIVATVPPGHIYGLLFTVIVPLLSGATVDRVARLFPREILDRVQEVDANVVVAGPAHLRALAREAWPRGRVSLVFSSGAPLSAADARAFQAQSGLWPVEVYGSTETGGIATRTQETSDPAWLPVEGVSVRLGDDECLAVRSPHLADDLPRQTDGYFRTADRARLREDGRFELLGRADGVVKVGGKRVDLFEVEEKVRLLQGVTDVVVIAREVDSGRGQEVGALVESKLRPIDLLRAVRDHLPPAAWPRVFRCVERIPLTPAGKRDRARIEALLFGAKG